MSCRWLLKRIMRYNFIECAFYGAVTEWSDRISKGTATNALPPLLPSLLAACAPSTKLSLTVRYHEGKSARANDAIADLNFSEAPHSSARHKDVPFTSVVHIVMASVGLLFRPGIEILSQLCRTPELAVATLSAGKRFLAMPSASFAPDVSPELSSLWANLKQHLTELKIWLDRKEVEVQCLQSLGMLTALQNLELYGPYSLHGPSGAAYTLKLPHLASLYCASLSGELVLSCPELLRARFSFTSLRPIMVEDAALEDLVLKDCNNIHVALAQDQLLKLKVLIVQECREVGRHLIEEVSEMRNLRTLAYEPFPTACMPTSFPLSLWEVFLFPRGWCSNLPEGLKGLQELRVFSL